MADAPGPQISVSIITYNQSDFIAAAIDSALAQRTSFTYEIRVGDDCSSDGTRELLERYRSKHPDRIFLNLQKVRPAGIPGRVNNTTNLQSCRGEYIAMLDGDDYWIDPEKLERQVAMLEDRSDLSGIASDALVVNQAGEPQSQRYAPSWLQYPVELSLEDILRGPSFATSSFVFRSRVLRDLPEWFQHVPAGDWALKALAAAEGAIAVEDRQSVAYRRHPGSVIAQLKRHSRSEQNRWFRESLLRLGEAFPEERSKPAFRRRLLRTRIVEQIDRKQRASAFASSLVYASSNPRGSLREASEIIRRYLRADSG